ncbi:MAG: hypothetical protein ACFFDH_03330 [Promethearchaeota archaeon]
MKFLLKQQLDFKKEQTVYYIYPNQFSSEFIKLARKRNLILDVNKTIETSWDGNYSVVESYEILENDFKRLLKDFQDQINEKRKKFYNRPFLEQLILILKYIYNRNTRAKEVSKYSAHAKAYNDKQEFLELALHIAKKITNKGFSYGFQEDPATNFYPYIYYFQVNDKQVSFHNEVLYSDCPEFKGKWIGYKNRTFPFNLREIKKL